MQELYIGLMSGTSVDGLDAVLVDFGADKPQVVATQYTPYAAALREQILSLTQAGANEIERMCELDVRLGRLFADSVNSLLAAARISPKQVRAIGSHGQNIRHAPRGRVPFTLQITDPNTIALQTGIVTVADFRRKDVAAGGQGAPLVPAFHQAIFQDMQADRAIVNIGGIANITLLPRNGKTVLGFDTGPGNALLDAWIFKHHGKHHDEQGAWGKQGKSQAALLEQLLADAYFHLAPPKSTGREYFNLAWLEHYLSAYSLAPYDVQATLIDLTAESILRAVRTYLSQGELLICGGGVKNALLMSRLAALSGDAFSVAPTNHYGVDADWVEAIAFAWLAKRTMEKQTGNLTCVTGAKQSVLLGGIYYP